MKKAERLTVALAGLLPLAGCGQYLGSYAVEQVHLVTEVPPSDFGSPSPSYGRYLEIGLASETSLTSIGGVGAVYVHADFCPLRNDNGLIAFGPYSNDKQSLGLPDDADALKASSDGLYRYRLYVVVAHRAQPETTPGQLQLPTYDLKQSNRDLCLRLFAPDYTLTKPLSGTIRVPAAMVSKALKAAASPSPR
jgi:hypothetical protein